MISKDHENVYFPSQQQNFKREQSIFRYDQNPFSINPFDIHIIENHIYK